MKSNKQIIEEAMDEIRSFGRDVDNEDFRNIIESALKQKDAEIKKLKDTLDICATSHDDLSEKIVLLNKQMEELKQKGCKQLEEIEERAISESKNCNIQRSEGLFDAVEIITKKQEEI